MANKNEQQQQSDRGFDSTGQDNNGMNRQSQQGSMDNAGSERGRADTGRDTDR